MEEDWSPVAQDLKGEDATQKAKEGGAVADVDDCEHSLDRCGRHDSSHRSVPTGADLLKGMAEWESSISRLSHDDSTEATHAVGRGDYGDYDDETGNTVGGVDVPVGRIVDDLCERTQVDDAALEQLFRIPHAERQHKDKGQSNCR